MVAFTRNLDGKRSGNKSSLRLRHTLESGGFRDCGTWDQNHLWGPCLKVFANVEYSSSYSPLKLYCITLCLAFSYQNHAYRGVARTL